jgi:hypothetical protein
MKACLVIHTLVGFIELGDENWEFMDELLQEGLQNAAPAGQVESDASVGRRNT